MLEAFCSGSGFDFMTKNGKLAIFCHLCVKDSSAEGNCFIYNIFIHLLLQMPGGIP